MKKNIIWITVIFSQAALGQLVDSRESLEAVTGSDRASAQKLLQAIKEHSKELIRKEIHELVLSKKTHLIYLALTDTSDQVKLETATTLATAKDKSIALALLNASKYLELAVWGGTEAEDLRARTKQAFDKSLSSITGVAVNKNWSPEQKEKAFREAVEKLPE